MRALIDGDILVYKCAFAIQKKIYTVSHLDEEFDEEIAKDFQYKKEAKEYIESLCADHELTDRVEVEEVRNAYHSINCMIKTIVEETKATSYQVFLTGSTNFRKEVATLAEYKAGRPPKPVHYKDVREFLMANHPTVESVDEEADDMLGYMQTDATCICSIDKDLLMIPGKHYNIDKRAKSKVSEPQGTTFFWHQMMTGDSTDNIPGLKGVGKAKADKVLDSCEFNLDLIEMEVKDMYRKQFGDEWERYINEMAQLLWIRRKAGEIKCVV